MIVVDDRVIGPNYEKDVLPKTDVDAWIIKVFNANILYWWGILAQLHKNIEHAFLLDHHLESFNLAYEGCSKVARHNI